MAFTPEDKQFLTKNFATKQDLRSTEERIIASAQRELHKTEDSIVSRINILEYDVREMRRTHQ